MFDTYNDGTVRAAVSRAPDEFGIDFPRKCLAV